MLWSLLGRSELAITAQHDRNPIYVTLSDGSIRNTYTLRLLNKRLEKRTFRIEVFGLPEAGISATDAASELGGRSMVVATAPDSSTEVKTFVTVPGKIALTGSRKITFRLSDVVSGRSATAKDNFVSPAGSSPGS
jgi:polyferredoxin